MDKQTFNELISAERILYLTDTPSKQKQMKRSKHKRYYIWKYLYYFRCCQFYQEQRSLKSLSSFERRLAKYKFKYYEKMKNIYSYKSGIEIGLNSHIGKNCDIWHSGVVINGNIGENCVFHGNNTIGNKGIGNEIDVPTLGNGVDIGVGAIIIGGITISDNCTIGAGAVVTKSFDTAKSIIVGVPGRIINKNV